LERLDAIIAILEWIVSQFYETHDHYVPQGNSSKLWLSRFVDKPYESLLAYAYHVRLYQAKRHTEWIRVCKHNYNVTECQDHVISDYYGDVLFDHHWYPTSPLTTDDHILYQENSMQCHDSLYAEILQVSSQYNAQPSELRVQTLMFMGQLLPKLRFLRGQDCLQEVFWQFLLAYVQVSYYRLINESTSLAEIQELESLDNFNSLYRPSRGEFDNHPVYQPYKKTLFLLF